jgi:hypothetical protein
MLPFTRAEFISVFGAYNTGVWPAQVLAYLVGLLVVGVLVRRSAGSGRIVGASLAAMWLWTGIAYHGVYFSAINRAALAFGAFFVLQGVLLMHASLIQRRLEFGASRGPMAWAGWTLVGYASLAYPVIGILAGDRYPELPMFGITPCPLTLFSVGVLMLAAPAPPWWLVAIPLAWSLVGGSAAFLLNVPQDWALFGAGVGALAIVVRAVARRFAHVAAA